MTKPWKEVFVDRMGWIICLSGQQRFDEMKKLNTDIAMLPLAQLRSEVKECLRMRFTPSNGADGCQSGTEAVREATR